MGIYYPPVHTIDTGAYLSQTVYGFTYEQTETRNNKMNREKKI